MRTGMVAVVSGVVAAALPWALAAGKVALDGGFDAGDLAPFGFWSALYGIGLTAISWLLVEITLGISPRSRYIAGAVVGAFAGLAFTVFVATVLGPWMGGFGFPVLHFWALGGIAALCLAVRLTGDVRA